MSPQFKDNIIKNLFFIALLSNPLYTFCEQELAKGEVAQSEQIIPIISNPEHNKDTNNDPFITEQELFIDDSEFDTSEFTQPPLQEDSENAEFEAQDDTSTREEQFEKLLAQAQENERCEILLKQVLENFRALDFDLEHIALVVNNNQIRKLTKKGPILDEIRKLRSIVGMIQQGAFVVIKTENLAQLIELAQKLIAHVRYVLTTDLMNFKSFDFEATVAPTTRLQFPKTYGFDQLETMLQKNNNLLVKLETESENAGLNSFHRIYRRLEKLNNDYKILHRLVVAGAVGLGTIWILHLTDYYFFEKAEELWNKFWGKTKVEKPQAKNNDIPPTSSTENQGTTQPTTAQPDETLNKYYQNYENGTEEYQKGFEYGAGKRAGQLAAQRSHELTKQQPKSSNEKKSWFMWIKDGLGTTTDPKFGMTNIPESQRSFLTYGRNFFERNLKLISFGFTPIVLFDLFKPTFTEWGKDAYSWLGARLAYVASFLRGGPVKRQMDLWAEKEIRITFDDVIGNEHAKETLFRIVSYLVDYEKFDRAGIIPETGILLVGPPRTGKTFIAEALAGTIKMMLREKGSNETIRLLSFTAAELKQYGISTVLLGAKALAPVVLFIDEIDTGRFQREGDAAALGELQVAMSTLNRDKSKKVIILAATNKPENLDYALLEPGRFGKHIDFTYPTFSERKEYLQRELSKRSANIAEEYIDKLSHESENCSYDALNEVIVTALQKAKVRGSVLTWEDLDSAFDEEINKIIIDEETIPEAEQYVIAAHQAGHAYMRILLNASLQLTKVTIRPTSAKINEQAVISKYFDNNNTNKNQKESKTIEYGKVFTAHNTNSLKFETYQDLVNELIISLAGHVAEKILFESCSYSYHTSDNDLALSMAKHIMFGGMQEKDMPKKIKEQKLTEAYELVQKYEKEATDLLTAHKKELIVITNILFEQKTLLAGDIMQILELVEKQKNENDTPQDGDNEDLDDTIKLGLEAAPAA